MSHQHEQPTPRGTGGGRAPIILLGLGLAAICAVAVAWALRPSEPGAGEGTLVPKVLCSSCEFFGDVTQVRLEGTAARVPVLGPGYKCPKCQKDTLYPNPYICKNCGKPFLAAAEGSGELSSKCPKCGTAN